MSASKPFFPLDPDIGTRPDYAIGRTAFGHFITAARDTAIGATIRNGHHFGQREVDRAVELVRRHRPGWKPRFFIDVGANIGTHIVYALGHVGFEDGMAFEIAPENFRMLRANLALNGIDPHGVAFEHGLSSSEGGVWIEKSPFNNGDFRVRGQQSSQSLERNRHREEDWDLEGGRVRTFDQSVPERLLDPLGTLVWIDTQGHETQVLAGADRLFEHSVPFVIEFWPYGLVRSGSSLDELWQWLLGCVVIELGEELKAIEPDCLREYFRQCLDTEGDGRSPHTDLLILPPGP